MSVEKAKVLNNLLKSKAFASMTPEERANILNSLDGMTGQQATSLVNQFPPDTATGGGGGGGGSDWADGITNYVKGKGKNFLKDAVKDLLGGGGYDFGSDIGGMGEGDYGGASGYDSAGESASSSSGLYAAIAAIIAAQWMASEDTETEFEGQKTGGIQDSHVFTEPWKGWVHDKLDIAPTSGEKMDAAIANDDWQLAVERAPANTHDIVIPGSDMGRGLVNKYTDGYGGAFVDPIGEYLSNPEEFPYESVDPIGRFLEKGLPDDTSKVDPLSQNISDWFDLDEEWSNPIANWLNDLF